MTPLRDVNIFPWLLQRKLTFLNITHHAPIFPTVTKGQSKGDNRDSISIAKCTLFGEGSLIRPCDAKHPESTSLGLWNRLERLICTVLGPGLLCKRRSNMRALLQSTRFNVACPEMHNGGMCGRMHMQSLLMKQKRDVPYSGPTRHDYQ